MKVSTVMVYLAGQTDISYKLGWEGLVGKGAVCPNLYEMGSDHIERHLRPSTYDVRSELESQTPP